MFVPAPHSTRKVTGRAWRTSGNSKCAVEVEGWAGITGSQASSNPGPGQPAQRPLSSPAPHEGVGKRCAEMRACGVFPGYFFLGFPLPNPLPPAPPPTPGPKHLITGFLSKGRQGKKSKGLHQEVHWKSHFRLVGLWTLAESMMVHTFFGSSSRIPNNIKQQQKKGPKNDYPFI